MIAASRGLSEERLIQTGVDYVKAENGKTKDDRKAVAFFLIAAQLNSMDAQSRLGFMYHQGLGVVLDYTEAARWFKLAADRGFPKAQFNLGLMYLLGQGVPIDERTAHALLRKSARQGYEDAKATLKELDVSM